MTEHVDGTTTGDARVDALVGRLDTLDLLEPAAQLEAFTQLHASLAEVLDEPVDQALPAQ